MCKLYIHNLYIIIHTYLTIYNKEKKLAVSENSVPISQMQTFSILNNVAFIISLGTEKLKNIIFE